MAARTATVLAAAANVRQQYARSGRAGLRFRSLKTGDHAWRDHRPGRRDDRRADGAPYDPDVATHRFRAANGAVPRRHRIRFHDQRHTHATLLLENGETEKYVAERLGDSVEMIHETYGHVTPRMRADAIAGWVS